MIFGYGQKDVLSVLENMKSQLGEDYEVNYAVKRFHRRANSTEWVKD